MHRRALAGLVAAPGRRPDVARVAHHAEAAGDVQAVVAHAPVAAERAAALGAHREAASQLERALRFAGGLPPGERGALLERRAYECYLTDLIPEAIEARREALELHRQRGDRLREGDSHRWLSRLAWFQADHPLAEKEAARAVELLEELPEGRELAMAYSNKAQLRMLATDLHGAVEWGERAIALAERLGETEILAHALNNVGTAELQAGLDSGVAKLERSLQLARAEGLEEHVARACTNLGSVGMVVRGYAFADGVLDRGIAYCQDRDLDSGARTCSAARAARAWSRHAGRRRRSAPPRFYATPEPPPRIASCRFASRDNCGPVAAIPTPGNRSTRPVSWRCARRSCRPWRLSPQRVQRPIGWPAMRTASARRPMT